MFVAFICVRVRCLDARSLAKGISLLPRCFFGYQIALFSNCQVHGKFNKTAMGAEEGHDRARRVKVFVGIAFSVEEAVWPRRNVEILSCQTR